MKRKGFTLIELLAVIVILAIISLIAVPMILNTIEKTKEGAALSSALNYVESIEEYMVTSKMLPGNQEFILGEKYYLIKESSYNESESDKYFIIDDKIDLKGSDVKDGYIIFDTQKVQEVVFIIDDFEIKCTEKTCEVLKKLNGEIASAIVTISENIITMSFKNAKKYCVTKDNSSDGCSWNDIDIKNEYTYKLEESGTYKIYVLDNAETIKNVKEITIEQNEICAYMIGTTWNFDYTDEEQEFITPCNGTYLIELWGAQGGFPNDFSKTGVDVNKYATGAYVSGKIKLTEANELLVYVGEQGKIDRSGNTFNGGGIGGVGAKANGPSGGGATDVRLISVTEDLTKSLNSRIMVAGSGGGASFYVDGGSRSIAGGLTGYIGNYYSGHGDKKQYGSGGNQNNGGSAGTNIYNATGTNNAGGFGIGGDSNSTSDGDGAGGGGSGYYGGGAGGGTKWGGSGQGGGGGSSFISGHTGCVAITSEENSTPISNCTTGTTDNNCSIHYSGYNFMETIMIDGAGYSWTNVKNSQQQMPKPDGTMYELGYGHIGNGYAKITYIGNN